MLLYPLIPRDLGKYWNLSLKKVIIFVIRRVLIKAKLFIPELIREEILIKYLLKDKL